MTKLEEFIGFASGKPADETYNFVNGCGGCAVGQWMAATGTAWNMDVYAGLVREMFHGTGPGPLASSETWGELHCKLKELV